MRWLVRQQSSVGMIAYQIPNVYYALTSRRHDRSSRTDGPRGRLALCLRFRDEARFLEEWLTYYRAAGVDHFFLYNNFSEDEYGGVLRPYTAAGWVTLIDWPMRPASPGAENDCIARTRGRFEWVGFLDADEFVVVKDGRSILEFLDSFGDVPAVALHRFHYGSDGHKTRPLDWVIQAYTRRAAEPDHHVKVFVRPDQVTRNRNPHNFYYKGARCAIREDGRRVFGSMARSPSTRTAWVNHYYSKSLEDYLEKASRDSTVDKSAMREPSRRRARARTAMAAGNEVADPSASDYFRERQRAFGGRGSRGAS